MCLATSAPMATHKKTSGSTLATQRRIQREQDARDAQRRPARSSASKQRPAVQAGARAQPQKLPAQHLTKPGRESDLPVCAGYISGIVLPVTGSVGAI
jgi:hypothetical protein